MSASIPFEGPWARHQWMHGFHRPWIGEDLAEQHSDRPDEPAPERPRGRGGRRGGRGRGRHFGPFGFEPGFGPGGFGHGGFGPGGFGPRGSRARRGDVRAAILALLTEEPMHGYQVIQEIAARSDGIWRPSAGSVYPALSLLEDEGLVRPDVRPDDEGGRKVFALTDAGRRYVAEHADDLVAPWDAVTGGVSESAGQIMDLVRQVGFAAVQVLRSGDATSVESARRILDQSRRSLYLVLAGEDPVEGSTGPAGPSPAGD
jgi:DNA-binding PadR family transcriptional regulator